MLYFTYGSNMNWQQMRERCQSARFVGVALLADHKLALTRKSVKRGCGVADAVREDGRKIWGVIYEIADLDVGNLDSSEGYRPGRERNSYQRRECLVLLDGDQQQPLTVCSYFGDPQSNSPLPNSEHKGLIVSGARHRHPPEAYVRDLEAIEVSR